MSRRFFFCLLICLCSFHYVQSQVHDDFTDGDFTTNPTWTGDASKFEVNASKQLHLNAPAVTDTAFNSTPNTLINDIEWDFFFKMDFAPSSSNFLKVYLVSDQQNLKQPLNGYFLRMGVDGSNDAIELYMQQGTTETLLMHGIDGHVAASTNSVSVKVTRDGSGNWVVYSDITGGTNYSLEGSATDNTITSTNYFGFFCKYTSTRSTLFYFDDVYVDAPFVDNTPPSVQSVKIISSNQLDVYYSEPVEAATAETESNYSVNNGIGNSSTALIDAIDKSLVHLSFPNNFQNGITNSITVSNVTDLVGNAMIASSTDFTFYQSQPKDILINEIMADPSPSIGLPDAEFVELYNNSTSPVDLSGWKFSDASTSQTLSSFTLQPNTYLILCDDANVSSFQSYGNVAALTSFPSLNNDGDDLSLKDASGNLIDAVSYDLAWYQDAIKSQGGYTLERIDPLSSCTGLSNWRASDDVTGGTPDKQNSVFGNYIDSIPPSLLRANVTDNTTLELVFGEALDSLSAVTISNYEVQPGITITNAQVSSPDFLNVTLTISPSLDTNVVYTIIANNLTDCHGNMMLTPDSAQVAIPSAIEINDIIINEILFNPKSGGYDFVELYNNTNNFFDLKDLRISNADDLDSLTNIKSITEESFLVFPNQFIVLSENTDWVKLNYFCENPSWMIDVTDLPSYNDDEGRVVLINNTNQRVDELHYNQTWHFALIDDVEGVSLERIDPNRITQDSMNWHSAASTIGYATPTYKNSQYSFTNVGNEISISPQIFSPDQDGYNDFLNINYSFDKAGYTANIRIYDAVGRETTNLIHNALLAQSGTFVWDGITDKGEKANVGTYIIYTEIFDLDGNVKHYKKVCVVAAKKS